MCVEEDRENLLGFFEGQDLYDDGYDLGKAMEAEFFSEVYFGTCDVLDGWHFSCSTVLDQAVKEWAAKQDVTLLEVHTRVTYNGNPGVIVGHRRDKLQYIVQIDGVSKNTQSIASAEDVVKIE